MPVSERRASVAKFSTRLDEAVSKFSAICIGIDPSESELDNWELPDSAAGAREYGLRIIDSAQDRLGIIKPQVGFFERFGSLGYQTLEEIIREAKDAGLIVIADAKRGDIGSTMLGYASAWFGDDSPLRSDALTVSGYLGPESLRETLHYAQDVQGGLFILAATSNPEAAQLQQALIGGKTVAANVIDAAKEIGQGEMGVVIGATQDLKAFGIGHITERDIEIPILAPGFGAQGARLEDLKEIFGASSHRVIASMSRELTKNGPEQLGHMIDKAKAKL
jgi:orotidine-5'-phosphate decarboxylase